MSEAVGARAAIAARWRSGGSASQPLVQLAALVAIGLVWQLGAEAAGTSILPGPAQTFPVFRDLVGSLKFLGPLGGSLQRTVIGFVVAFVIGVAYGIAAGRSRAFGRITSLVFQVLLFANTLVLILWGLAILGNTNTWSVVVVIAIAVFPNIAVYMRDVIRVMDADVLEMSDAYRTGVVQRVVDVYLPYLAPSMLAAARIGFSLSWKVDMLSEVFGFPSGVGYQIRQSYTGYNLPLVISWLLVFVVTLLLVEQLIRIVERRAIRWQ